MVLPGHLGGGYLMARALLSVFHPVFSQAQVTALMVIGTLCGDLPDIDLIAFSYTHFFKKNSAKEQHREYITHMPLFWLIPSMTVVAAGAVFGSPFVEYVGWLILIGSWTHLLLDSIEYGVAWLWPISRRRFALRYPPEEKSSHATGSIGYYWEFIRNRYAKNITFYIEILIAAAAIYVLFRH